MAQFIKLALTFCQNCIKSISANFLQCGDSRSDRQYFLKAADSKVLVQGDNSELPAMDGIAVPVGIPEVTPGRCTFIVL